MEIVFNTKEYARKLLMIHSMFDRPGFLPDGMKRMPALVGKDFYTEAKIYRRMFISQDRIMSASTLLDPTKNPSVSEFLYTLKIPMLAETDKFFDIMVNEMSSAIGSVSADLERWIKQLFEAALPEKVIVVLSDSGSVAVNAFGSSFNYTDPPIICCFVSSEDPKQAAKEAVPVLIHELIRIIVSKQHAMSFDNEEALIDYFAPHGILTERLGLTEKASIEEYAKQNSMANPRSSAVTNALLPYIKSLCQQIETQSVWSALKSFEY